MEHKYGVNITTLDNPGRSVTIDLNPTRKQGVPLARGAIERTEYDWIFYGLPRTASTSRAAPETWPKPFGCS